MSDYSLSSGSGIFDDPTKKDEEPPQQDEDSEANSDFLYKSVAFEQFNSFFESDVLLKTGSFKNLVYSMTPKLLKQFTGVTDREGLINYVEGLYSYLRITPQKFVFFLAQPEPLDYTETLFVIIKSDRQVLLARKSNLVALKGYVIDVLFKSRKRIQFLMSSHLVINFCLRKSYKHLQTILPDFLGLSNETVNHSVEELFFSSLLDLHEPSSFMNHELKNLFLNLILAPNLEFCRKLATYPFSNPDSVTDVTQSLFIIFEKSHLFFHLMKVYIPMYFETIQKPSDILKEGANDLIPNLIIIARYHFGLGILPEIAKILHDVICSKDLDEYQILTFAQIVFSINFPMQIIFLAKQLFDACIAKFPKYENIAYNLIGRFLFTEFILIPIYEMSSDRKEKKRFVAFYNMLLLDKQHRELKPFFPVVKKLYLYLVNLSLCEEKLAHISNTDFYKGTMGLFTFFAKDCVPLQKHFSGIDLSSQPTPVHERIMEMFKWADDIKNDSVPKTVTEDEIITDIRKLHKNIKFSIVSIRTLEKDKQERKEQRKRNREMEEKGKAKKKKK